MKVLIPVDGSQQALNTLKAVAGFLDKKTSELYLYTVQVPVATEVAWAMMEDNEGMVQTLNQAKQEASNLGFTVAKTEHSTFHEPATAICEYADEVGVDMILMGSHGYQGLEKFLMGSVSERVFKQARQPVVIVRNDKNHSVSISHFEKTNLGQVKV